MELVATVRDLSTHYGARPYNSRVFEPSEAEREGESVRYLKELRFGDLEVIEIRLCRQRIRSLKLLSP